VLPINRRVTENQNRDWTYEELLPELCPRHEDLPDGSLPYLCSEKTWKLLKGEVLGRIDYYGEREKGFRKYDWAPSKEESDNEGNCNTYTMSCAVRMRGPQALEEYKHVSHTYRSTVRRGIFKVVSWLGFGNSMTRT